MMGRRSQWLIILSDLRNRLTLWMNLTHKSVFAKASMKNLKSILTTTFFSCLNQWFEYLTLFKKMILYQILKKKSQKTQKTNLINCTTFRKSILNFCSQGQRRLTNSSLTALDGLMCTELLKSFKWQYEI